MRLKGRELQDTEDGILADVGRGQLERGTSPWGSWAFPVYMGAKVRIVVHYQRVNSVTVRAIYYLRRADDCKQEVLGSVYMSLLDAVSGFNQVRNSERARRVLAVLAASGCYLPNCLTMGGSNGPEDFCFTVDTLFGLGQHHERRLNRQWIVYIDDFACRTGRWKHGHPVTDEEHAQELRQSASRPAPQWKKSGPEFDSDYAGDGPAVSSNDKAAAAEADQEQQQMSRHNNTKTFYMII